MYEAGYNSVMTSTLELLFWWGYAIGYLYFAICFYRIARNCGEKDSAWWAFIPLVQFILMLKIAQKPLWWFVLILIPIVNLVPLAIAWASIARRCGKSETWGILSLVPVVSFFTLAVLAMSKPRSSFFDPPPVPDQPRTPQSVR